MKPLLVLSSALILSAGASAQVMGGNGLPNPNYANLWAWYDASDGVNGPGQPIDGASVTSWQDSSVQGHSLVRVDVNASEQPVFRATAVNGLPAIEFDGNDYIWGDNSSEFGTISSGKTIFVVSEVDTANIDGYIFDSSSGAGRNALFTGTLAIAGAWQIWTGTSLVGGTVPVVRDQFQVHSVVLDSGNQEHFVDGTSIYSDTQSISDLSGFILGSRYTVANFLIGHIAEVLVYDEVLLAADRQAIEDYLDAKYINIVPPAPTLAAQNLVGGSLATLSLSNCTPLGGGLIAYSLAGGGPINTPWGPAFISAPYSQLPPLTIDPLGDASISINVPLRAAGRTVWLHALDQASGTLTNPLMEVIG
ncbi:MAG: hypothetical protein GY747_08125 [Planctomycetes bacterium]|nr:hypothetical protein [Planctomycetota bacterium]MCP4771148.1 hypothetical protein [Planctomycetota bacterium]MCP4862125.1 hypothetical protein [Planctomycetota bacterium]